MFQVLGNMLKKVLYLLWHRKLKRKRCNWISKSLSNLLHFTYLLTFVRLLLFTYLVVSIFMLFIINIILFALVNNDNRNTAYGSGSEGSKSNRDIINMQSNLDSVYVIPNRVRILSLFHSYIQYLYDEFIYISWKQLNEYQMVMFLIHQFYGFITDCRSLGLIKSTQKF